MPAHSSVILSRAPTLEKEQAAITAVLSVLSAALVFCFPSRSTSRQYIKHDTLKYMPTRDHGCRGYILPQRLQAHTFEQLMKSKPKFMCTSHNAKKIRYIVHRRVFLHYSTTRIAVRWVIPLDDIHYILAVSHRQRLKNLEFPLLRCTCRLYRRQTFYSVK